MPNDPRDPRNTGALQGPQEYEPRVGLKKQTTGQKSMFEGKVKPPTQQDFQKKVEESQEKMAGYKKRAAELFVQFNKTVMDKTLPQNRNVFNMESEKEMLQNMIQLAIEINNDPNEQEGMGSLTWITCLFKTTLAQRDRINELEYAVTMMQKKLDSSALADYINKEITKALDKKKTGE
jgi:hypothetical protein